MAKQKLKLKRSAAAVLYGLGLLAVTTALYALFPSAFENGKNATDVFHNCRPRPESAKRRRGFFPVPRAIVRALRRWKVYPLQRRKSPLHRILPMRLRRRREAKRARPSKKPPEKRPLLPKTITALRFVKPTGQNAKTILIDAGHGGSDLGDGRQRRQSGK